MSIIRQIAIALLLLAASAAHAFTLSGTVFGGGSPLPNATVTLFDAGTSPQLAQTVTNGSGQYSFTVNAGTYNLQVTPQAPSAYGSSTLNGIAISSANVVQDIVLVPASFTLSGVVRLPDGRALTEVQIGVVPQSAGGSSASAWTDNTGAFSVSVVAGTYSINVEATYTPPRFKVDDVRLPGLPTLFSVYSAAKNIVVSANTTANVTIPFVVLSGKTTDSNAVAVANVSLTTSRPAFQDCTVLPCTQYALSHLPGFATPSDASGNYSMWLFPGTYNLSLLPPSSATTVAQATFNNFSVSASTVHDFQLPSAFLLSGVVRLPDGRALTEVQVGVVPQSAGGSSASAWTDNTGAFSVSVVAGTYAINVEATYTPPRFKVDDVRLPGLPTLFGVYNAAKNIAVSANTTANVTVPFVVLSGKTTDSNAVAVANVSLTTSRPPFQDCTVLPCTQYTLSHLPGFATPSDASGNYSMWLFPGTYNLSLLPPSSAATVAQTTFNNFSVSASTLHDFQLQSAFILSGVVRLPDGRALTEVQIGVVPQSAGGSPASAWTDDTGAFSVSVVAGTYSINAEATYTPPRFKVDGVRLPGLPTLFSVYSAAKNIVVSANTTANVTIPFVVLSGKTTDSNAVAVANVSLTTSRPPFQDCTVLPCTQYALSHLPGFATPSDASGNYSMWLFPGSFYNIDFVPPSGSGFAQNTTNGIVVAASQLLNLILTLPDTRAPLILSGPFVKELTSSRAVVEWLTNEPTGAVVTVNGNPFTESGAARTQHSVQVTGLAAATAYVAQVASTDTSGNGPATGSAPFTTKPAPDTTPPLFVDGPIVTAITHNSAVVEWATDEPASAVVNYGLTTSFGSTASNGASLARHRLELTGLSPSLTYHLRGSATDASSNGPTLSATLSFKTLAAADLIAPAIIGKPIAVDVTANAATIAWITDKPATSGVSWNDGTAYGLVSDGAFVTAHTVRITGLVAGRPYTVTASSKDERDNGPTLSAITFATLPAGDVQPPVLTCGPQVLNVTRKTASIRWCTSEHSDARVLYGTTPASLNESQSKAQLDTTHILTLTGLSQGTTYYYRVESRDVAGNASAPGTVLSFSTPAVAADSLIFEQLPTLMYKGDKLLTIEWATSAPADALLECAPAAGGETRRVTRAERDTTHQLTISNLLPSLAYSCRVKSIDIDGNTVEQ